MNNKHPKETIINNLSEDEFDGVQLFNYKLTFNNINEEQKNFIIERFNDWEDPSAGLYIAELTVEYDVFANTKVTFDNIPFDDGSLTEFSFKSPFEFEYKDLAELNDEDYENNLLAKLLGKNQFIQQLYFLGTEYKLDERQLIFTDNDGYIYDVEISKDPDIKYNIFFEK